MSNLPWPGRRGAEYDRLFEERAARGEHVHGEADFVMALGPRSVLDAGCGTGRVAVELQRRGVAILGVDQDPVMLEAARRKAPALEWMQADLAYLDLRDPDGARRRFDAAVLAGNVMLFVERGAERQVVEHVARHLVPGGALVCGMQTALAGRLTLAEYDAHCVAARLVLVDRFATWDRVPWTEAGSYAVSVHRAAG